MAWFRTFGAQLAVTGVAALSLLALASLLVRDVIVGAEERLAEAAEQQCARAAAELAEQFLARRAFREDARLEDLPPEALDLSLGALTATVLRSFEGVNGGFLVGGRVAGRASGVGFSAVEGLSAVEESLLAEPGMAGRPRRTADDQDVVVAAVVKVTPDEVFAWAQKRLPEATRAVPSQRAWLLGGLAVSALLGFGALLSMSLQLRRGVEGLQSGLGRLESDVSYRLPSVAGDLGAVAEAVNKMADARTGLEERVRRNERLAALGRVVGGVAHEIRNPLNSMRLTLELLARRIRRGEADEAQVTAAVAEVDRLDGILTKLLAFGRPGSEQRELQPIRPLAERAANMAREKATGRGIQIGLEDSGAPAVTIDGSQIEQVLLNLLLNAVEASPDGGDIRVRLADDARQAVVEIEDEGLGIAPDTQERLFEPYFTTKDTGSGLGLAVSREIAQRHGGLLEFESQPGKTIFRLTLPAASGEAA